MNRPRFETPLSSKEIPIKSIRIVHDDNKFVVRLMLDYVYVRNIDGSKERVENYYHTLTCDSLQFNCNEIKMLFGIDAIEQMEITKQEDEKYKFNIHVEFHKRTERKFYQNQPDVDWTTKGSIDFYCNNFEVKLNFDNGKD